MNTTCPVCAFTEMPYAAVPYNICPCCGTEFGVDDHVQSISDIRQAWIAQGMPWFDDITSPPLNWSPLKQLIDAGFAADLVSISGSATTTEQVHLVLETKPFWNVRDLELLKVA